MEAMERRTNVRAPVSLMGAVEVDGSEAPAVVLDLSTTGAHLQTDSPPDPNHEYQLHFNVHHTSYSPHFRVVRWTGVGGAYHWGCTFSDLSDEERDNLRRTVQAVSGSSVLAVRRWDEILADAGGAPERQVLIGTTPAGRHIKLAASDCLEMGQAGVDLFVRTVASLEDV